MVLFSNINRLLCPVLCTAINSVKMYKCDIGRMSEKIHTFAKFGDAGHGGITRYSLSAESVQAREYFVQRMTAIGATITTDDLANMYATLKGSQPGICGVGCRRHLVGLKKIVTGSHCDSVKNGGNYDGILGVIAAMEVLESVVHNKIPHRHDLVAMIWTNEEGSLYPPAMMCSGIVCHDYLPMSMQPNFEHSKMMNSKGVIPGSGTFGESLSNFKFRGDKKNRLNPNDYMCMVELHIEQGPILEDNKNEIGVVDCVLGMFNYRINMRGQSDHAGTTPMNKRQDALFAASQAICYLHEEIDKLNDKQLVYTTGELTIHPCVHTVIPDEVEFSIDVRHPDPEVRAKVLAIVKSLATKEDGWARCKCTVREMWKRDTVHWDHQLVDYVKKSAEELGYRHQYVHSGAGHDAQFAWYMLPTTMIFVPSKDGHSHCELEHTSDQECTAGASVLLNTILKADHVDIIKRE